FRRARSANSGQRFPERPGSARALFAYAERVTGPSDANAAQREYWNAARHWVEDADGHDDMLEALGRLAIDALGLEAGMRVLDIGCGTGATTRQLAAAVAPGGEAVGADVSALLLDVARVRPWVELSMAGDDGPNPFALGDPERLRDILARARFSGVVLEDVRQPVLLGGRGDIDTGLGFLAGARLGRQIRDEASDPQAAFAAVRAALGPYVTSDGVRMTAAVWLATAGA